MEDIMACTKSWLGMKPQMIRGWLLGGAPRYSVCLFVRNFLGLTLLIIVVVVGGVGGRLPKGPLLMKDATTFR